MRVRVIGGVGDLARDMKAIPPKAVSRLGKVVKTNAREGRDQARVYARESSPVHGVHYVKAITHEQIGPLAWEYGPDPSMPQGNMDFEWGSGRQSRPHLNLARSADVIGRQFADDVSDTVEGLFW